MEDDVSDLEKPPPYTSTPSKMSAMPSLMMAFSGSSSNLPLCNGQNSPDATYSEGSPPNSGQDNFESIHNNKDGHDDLMDDESQEDFSQFYQPPKSSSSNCLKNEQSEQAKSIASSGALWDSSEHMMEENDDVLSDGESFEGKIVYNPDGSAYIIEGAESDLSDSESIFPIPKHEGTIVEQKGKVLCAHSAPSFPQIANAFYIQRTSSNFLNNLYMFHDNRPRVEAPIMHSYRVYDVREGNTSSDQKHVSDGDSDSSDNNSVLDTSNQQSSDALSVPTKPILMCFICKLSFGYAKSFVAHAISEHNMSLNDDERRIMGRKNASAIIQGLGKDKEPLMSFLEPLSVSKPAVPSGSSGCTGRPQSPPPMLAGHASPASTSLTYAQTLAVTAQEQPKGNPVTSVHGELSTSAASSVCNGAGVGQTGYPPISVGHYPQGAMSQLQGGDRNAYSSLNAHNMRERRTSDSSTRPTEADSSVPRSAPSQDEYSRKEEKDDTASTNDDNNEEDDDRVTASSKASRSSVSPSQGSLGNGTFGEDASEETTEGQLGVLSNPSTLSPGSAGLGHGASPKLPVQQGLVITGCEEHPQGKQAGVECSRCDLMMESSRTLGGQLGLLHSRNSCKTLKCPKCNWHYKYQETLEIHMKEKHPENDTHCIYCITNQAHPRLSRGEVYTCGYKPYRCEVCNYSTTTKGNLSIHMQSDKHINNMQELQKVQAHNGSPSVVPTISTPQPAPNTEVPAVSRKTTKPKPSWRCDVCNYETNVARNLRIHMTSEKHTHNMMMLQQNMKTMQRDMQLHLNQMAMFGQEPAMFPVPPFAQPGFPPFPMDQAAMFMGPPFAQNIPNMENPVNLTKENDGTMGYGDQSLDVKNNNNEPSRLFQCAVCNVYSCDTIEALHQHMQMDRTRQGDGGENVVISSGNYMCKLCTYKTNLKANFQLHCKTDKHMQRLQLVCHIREGGPQNEWRVKYMNASNPVQVKCTICDYFTNSIHKLQLHTTDPRHEASAKLYHHLQQMEAKVDAAHKYFTCTVCQYNTKNKLNLIQHVRTIKHMKHERAKMMQLAEQGSDMQVQLGAMFGVKEYQEGDHIKFDEDGDEDKIHTPEGDKGVTPASETKTKGNGAATPQPGPSGSSDPIHMCPYCNYSSVNEMRIQAHIVAQHTQSQPQQKMLCPLCQDSFSERQRLEKHLVQVHNVTAEGLQRLLTMVETAPPVSCSETQPPLMVPAQPKLTSPPLLHAPSPIPDASTPSRSPSNAPSIPPSPAPKTPPQAEAMPTLKPVSTSPADDEMVEEKEELLENEVLNMMEEATKDGIYLSDKEGEEQYRCQMCSKAFANIDALYSHQNELGHLELKQTPRGPGYLCWKKGCNQYFKTAQALQVHFREIHAKSNQVPVSERHVYKFRCSQCSLAFRTMEKLQLHSKYHLYRDATRCSQCERSFRSISALQRHTEATHVSNMTESEIFEYRNNLASAANIFGGKMLQSLKDSLEHKKEGQTKEADQERSASNCTAKEQVPTEVVTQDHTNGSIPEENNINSPASARYQEHEYENREPTQDDLMNSVAIAEGSYDDPTRKYKCHRCKVAFTKQSYLSTHNKTVMHRKGDKLSYPLEKYLDPNRPYKCETCKESFTQKNILLVHFNSVSHLHKLKQVAQQQEQEQQQQQQQQCLQGQQSQLQQQSQQQCAAASQAHSSHATAPHSMSSSLLSPPPPLMHPAQSPRPVSAGAEISSVKSPQPTSARAEISHVKSPHLTSAGAEIPAAKSPVSAQHLPAQAASPTDDKKPYKCNICKVAYSQGTTLDIHMRSVLHQTRASKLHELVISGQVDLGQALIEQPDPAKAVSNKQVIGEMLQQKLNPQHSVSKTITSPTSLTSWTPPELLPIKQEPKTPMRDSPKVKDGAASMYAQREMQFLGEKDAASRPSASAFQQTDETPLKQQMQNLFQPPLTSQEQIVALKNTPGRYLPRGFKPHLHKSLLENFGFECVMQFNEYHQRKRMKKEPVDDMQPDDSAAAADGENIANGPGTSAEGADRETCSHPLLPEVNKCKCSVCDKEFSSIWVLKAHQEEIHKELVDIDLVEQLGEKFREVFEKKCALAAQQTEQSCETPTTSSCPPVDQSRSMPQTPVEGSLPATPTTPFDLNSFNAQMMQMPMFGMMPFPMPMGMPMPMNMPPPFMPMMMMPPGMEASAGFPGFPGMPMLDPAMMAAQRAAQEQANNAKRVRTRINDEQLKILRAHFDINNSPSEEQILEMSEKSGLPPKVIKHWFRNTLFKERQRNKDSPYNFSVPPATSINLEEYEKTGKINVTAQEAAEKHHQNELAESKRLSLMKMEEHVKQEKSDCDARSTSSHDSSASSVSSTPALCTPKSLIPSTHMGQLVSAASMHSQNMMSKMGPLSSQHQHQQLNKTHPLSLPSPSPQALPTKRANRTRFTDHQIKTLQEYFERNAYPKDDDLEHLSKLLNLSPRVIVVWFQNARQKARKSYENQPPLDLSEDGSRFNRTPGLNYQCKKCMTVFQRYFELIKHQQTQCYKDEIDHSQISPQSRRGSSTTVSPLASPECSMQGPVERSLDHSLERPRSESKPPPPVSPATPVSSKPSTSMPNATSQLMSPQNMFPGFGPNSAFAMLQNVAQQSQTQQSDSDRWNIMQSSPGKRKAEDDDDQDDQPRDKRLRTTILPEQLDYLYQQYQVECSPSRKQLEDIAAKVGLKKRVVQVWFQNTRARERKGQYRAHQQLIHKRCPFCRALFRAKSALESHLATKHPEEMAKGEINVDSIPDAMPDPLPPQSSSSTSSHSPGLDMAKLMANPYNLPSPFMQLMPPTNFPPNDPLQANMSQLYQDSFKKYIDKLSGASHQVKTSAPSAHQSNTFKNSSCLPDEDAPLDLSKPIRINTNMDRSLDRSMDRFPEDVIDKSESGYSIEYRMMDDSRSETHSESTENDLNDSGSHQGDSAPPSPNMLSRPHHQTIPGKRYRTQMSSLQIKCMKSIFNEYKTPTMSECELLGHEIGLPKRVVQVWFQNARAKEKKSKLAYSKTFGAEIELPRPPEECRLCNFKYTHKYTIQDHLFTKKHIENVKRFTQSQCEAEGIGSAPVSSSSTGSAPRGVEQAMQSLASKASMSSHPQLAQLQALGLQAMSMPGPMANLTAGGSGLNEEVKSTSSAPSGSEVKVKQEPKEETTPVTKKVSSSEPSHDPAQLAAMSGMFPGGDISALSSMMYPGMGGMYPGSMGFPVVPPGFMPGPEMFMYDPTIFGTPLALLQIPQEAIRYVQVKVQDQGCTITTYTQDCKNLSDLRDVINAQDYAVAGEARLDVGFICKKCSMVYPGKEACISHQQTVCYQGKNVVELKAILKLEQIQYECKACQEKYSTQAEFKSHCNTEAHKQRLHKVNKDGESSSKPRQAKVSTEH